MFSKTCSLQKKVKNRSLKNQWKCVPSSSPTEALYHRQRASSSVPLASRTHEGPIIYISAWPAPVKLLHRYPRLPPATIMVYNLRKGKKSPVVKWFPFADFRPHVPRYASTKFTTHRFRDPDNPVPGACAWLIDVNSIKLFIPMCPPSGEKSQPPPELSFRDDGDIINVNWTPYLLRLNLRVVIFRLGLRERARVEAQFLKGRTRACKTGP